MFARFTSLFMVMIPKSSDDAKLNPFSIHQIHQISQPHFRVIFKRNKEKKGRVTWKKLIANPVNGNPKMKDLKDLHLLGGCTNLRSFCIPFQLCVHLCLPPIVHQPNKPVVKVVTSQDSELRTAFFKGVSSSTFLSMVVDFQGI